MVLKLLVGNYKQKHDHTPTAVHINALRRTLFSKAPCYAWDLLESEMAVELNDNLPGQAIAKLLQLYMKGVEVMNSCVDPRESYFRSKVTSLMMRGNVVKTLNKPPPMAKKRQHHETKAVEHNSTHQLGQNCPNPGQQSVQNVTVDPITRQEKKRELEMRLTYATSDHTPQHLNELVKAHQQKQHAFKNKIDGIILDHEERLQARIKRRKERTLTQRSVIDETQDTSTKQRGRGCHQKDFKEDSWMFRAKVKAIRDRKQARSLSHEKERDNMKRHSSLESKRSQQNTTLSMPEGEQ